jgi:5'-nucleotidase
MDRGVTNIAPTKHTTPTRAVPPDPSFVSVPASAAQPKFVPVDTPAVDASSMISATPAPAPLPPAPVAPAPAITQTPAAAPAVAPAPIASTAAGGTRQYKVQKGDTLFHIAKAHYGDGNRWQQIASANAGLTPATLKAGTTIVVP